MENTEFSILSYVRFGGRLFIFFDIHPSQKVKIKKWIHYSNLLCQAICGVTPDIAVTPDITVKARRMDGSTYQVLIKIEFTQRKTLIIHWLLRAS
ncbi:30S ribosomal protein S7, chloroplastic, partial [Mucuna pruriens]